jgi:hypothetical protein
MNPKGLVAIVLFVWIILSYIVTAIASIPYLGGAFASGQLHSMASFTVQYSWIFWINIVFFIVLGFIHEPKIEIGLFILLETIIAFIILFNMQGGI